MTKKANIDKSSIIKLAKEGKTPTQMAVIFGVHRQTIHAHCKEHGINIRDYHFCHDFFQKIDSEEKSYWLGYFFADGCINMSSNSYKVDLTSKDIDHIKLWHKSIKSIRPIYRNRKIYGVSTHVSQKMFNDLKRHGCVERKSLILEFPTTVPKKLLHHFVRGYFDGDGCISDGGGKRSKTKPTICICGTKKFISGMIEHCPIKLHFYSRKGQKIFVAQSSRRVTVTRFYNWMYKDATIFMERKKTKFETLMGSNNFE